MRFRGVSRSTTTTSTATSMIPMKTMIGVGELVLPDDPGRPDAEPGDHDDEDGPDQYEEHGDNLSVDRRVASDEQHAIG